MLRNVLIILAPDVFKRIGLDIVILFEMAAARATIRRLGADGLCD